jgi:hypothetical protein
VAKLMPCGKLCVPASGNCVASRPDPSALVVVPVEIPPSLAGRPSPRLSPRFSHEQRIHHYPVRRICCCRPPLCGTRQVQCQASKHKRPSPLASLYRRDSRNRFICHLFDLLVRAYCGDVRVPASRPHERDNIAANL